MCFRWDVVEDLLETVGSSDMYFRRQGRFNAPKCALQRVHEETLRIWD
jgi:hypothetical protein